jgi:hypothetical protein
MKIKSQKDFFAGLMFMVVGIAFAWGATNYTIGEGARMGPGYFPLRWAWKPLAFIIGANLIFGICLGGIPKLGIPALGLIVGIYALVFVASLAGDEFKAREVAILATVLAIGSYLAFVVALKLQFPVWPSFIAR